MPIHCPVQFQPVTNEQFKAIDAVFMGCCYDSQNFLGRLCGERVYENDVSARLKAQGFSDVHTQIPVTVSSGSFCKVYRLDMAVNGVIYELKTTNHFAPEHKAQAIHYAALANVERVKLINFRTPRVEGSLSRAPVWNRGSREPTFAMQNWMPLSQNCERFLIRAREIFSEWGAFLSADLYEEALIDFFGGPAFCLGALPVTRDGIFLGKHRMPCHSNGIGFAISAIVEHADKHGVQLERLLANTSLNGIQWINLKHSTIQITTLKKTRSPITIYPSET